MTNEELYTTVLDLVNQNSTNNNIALDKGRLVSLYNTFILKYINYGLSKGNSTEIRKMAFLLKRKKMKEEKNTERYNSYSFPKDFFEFSNVLPIFVSDSCSGEMVCEVAREVKPDEIDLQYSDAYQQPSFEAAETLYHQSEGGLDIYKKDFEIKSTELLYYRRPIKIDMSGYEKTDGSQSADIQNDIPDDILYDVALMMAKIFTGSKEEMQKYQILNNELNFKK